MQGDKVGNKTQAIAMIIMPGGSTLPCFSVDTQGRKKERLSVVMLNGLRMNDDIVLLPFWRGRCDRIKRKKRNLPGQPGQQVKYCTS
jgi:hypothetical protein